MDTRQPHDIVPLAEITKDELHYYVPLSDADFAKLRRMSPHERGRWLKQNFVPEQRLRDVMADVPVKPLPSPEEAVRKLLPPGI